MEKEDIEKKEKENLKRKKTPMKNITINIPDNYNENIEYLKKKKLIASRSEAVRTAIREFLQKEYGQNLELLNFFPKKKDKDLINKKEEKLTNVKIPIKESSNSEEIKENNNSFKENREKFPNEPSFKYMNEP